MISAKFRLLVATSLILLLLLSPRISTASTPHYAVVTLAGDPSLGARFQGGMKTPAGIYDINTVNGSPGFLNGTSGATADFSVTPQGLNTTELIALAIHVNDAAGPSHSISSLYDPTLADLVSDLNNSHALGVVPVAAYAFNAAPPQFATAISSLSLSEAALGGQSFDILLTANNPGFNQWWALDLSQEINNLDGITALSVTDVGAVPEPTALAPFLATALLLRRSRRCRQRKFSVSQEAR